MRRTPLFDRHVALGARMVEFAGWDMPVQYPTGIVEEHLRTRRSAGLFDVSHMGRFEFRGPGAVGFLQGVLTNNVAALGPGRAQYTIIPTSSGGALDDAYLYCLDREHFLLVVNAANREQDWRFLNAARRDRAGVEMTDRSEELAMLSLQGPESRPILLRLLAEDSGHGDAPGKDGRGEDATAEDGLGERSLPEPGRNNLCSAALAGISLTIARTG
jgi:aminomethyltransferase